MTIDAVTGRIDLDPSSVPPGCDPVLGSVPFGPKVAVLGVSGSTGGAVQLWDDPITQNPAVGTTEQWEMCNPSADAHPIPNFHGHLIAALLCSSPHAAHLRKCWASASAPSTKS